MTHSSSLPYQRYRARLKKNTAVFLFGVVSFLTAAILGYFAGNNFLEDYRLFTLSYAEPFAGCHLFVEYLQRAALIVRSGFLEISLLLLLAYLKFDTVLTAAYFAFRGIVFGTALFFCARADMGGYAVYFPAVYAAVTAVYLLFARSLHLENGTRPLPEALVRAFIVCGAVSSIQLLISFFL